MNSHCPPGVSADALYELQLDAARWLAMVAALLSLYAAVRQRDRPPGHGDDDANNNMDTSAVGSVNDDSVPPPVVPSPPRWQVGGRLLMWAFPCVRMHSRFAFRRVPFSEAWMVVLWCSRTAWVLFMTLVLGLPFRRLHAVPETCGADVWSFLVVASHALFWLALQGTLTAEMTSVVVRAPPTSTVPALALVMFCTVSAATVGCVAILIDAGGDLYETHEWVASVVTSLVFVWVFGIGLGMIVSATRAKATPVCAHSNENGETRHRRQQPPLGEAFPALSRTSVPPGSVGALDV